jgi:hypothetical protein
VSNREYLVLVNCGQAVCVGVVGCSGPCGTEIELVALRTAEGSCSSTSAVSVPVYSNIQLQCCEYNLLWSKRFRIVNKVLRVI